MGTVYFSVITPVPVVECEVENKVDLNIWFSGDETLRFAMPKGKDGMRTFILPTFEADKVQMSVSEVSSMRTLFKEPFEPIGGKKAIVQIGLQWGEYVKTLRDIFHRPQLIKIFNCAAGSTTIDSIFWQDIVNTADTNWWILYQMFLQHRGSVRFTFVIDSVENTEVRSHMSIVAGLQMAKTLTNRFDVPQRVTPTANVHWFESYTYHRQYFDNRGIFQIEQPFTTRCNWIGRAYAGDIDHEDWEYDQLVTYAIINGNASEHVGISLFMSMGDDYSAGWPTPLPQYYTVPEAKKGKKVDNNNSKIIKEKKKKDTVLDL